MEARLTLALVRLEEALAAFEPGLERRTRDQLQVRREGRVPYIIYV